MKWISTRGQAPAVSFSEALNRGLAPDGGLYVPEKFPSVELAERLAAHSPAMSFAEFGAALLKPFLEGDPLQAKLPAICAAAFNFPLPVKTLKHETSVLELFHGPTAAFKDVGARFLAECFVAEESAGISRSRTTASRPRTVIVATSGDTGGAVAGAFFGKPGIEVFVLYPKGKISARQEKQIACWGGNVRAFSVRGTFDDCQRVVKEALADGELRKKREFISANSISIGRLLPQMLYYAKASADYWHHNGRAPGFIVPTGNLGNAVAALWAKRLGFPIAKVVLATNANRSILNYFESGKWQPNPTVATLANAMDVGNPSNMERLRLLYPDLAKLKEDVSVVSVSDAEIQVAIRRGVTEWGEIWCPHTATAAVARERIGGSDWIMVATAHPAKFETIVEPLLDGPNGAREIEIPPALKSLLNRVPQSTEIDPALESLLSAIA